MRESILNRQPWMERGACRGAPDPDIFLSKTHEEVVEAKSYCRRCAVCQECLDYALKRPEPFGVWGGKASHERKNHLQAV